jgi:CHAT domain-containing protein
LLDELDAAEGSYRPDPDDPDVARRNEVLTEIDEIERELMAGTVREDEIAERLARLDGLEAEERRFRLGIAERDPTFAGLETPAVPTLVEVQQSLAPDEALVSFLLPPTRPTAPWAFVVTADDARAYALPEVDRIESMVRVFTGLFPRRDGSEQAAAERLYRDLLGPALDTRPRVRRLVLIPDGVLHGLPFAALRSPGHGEALGSRHAISHAPSATAFHRWRVGRGAAARAPVLALIDPEFAGAAGTANADAEAATARRADAEAAGLLRLPHARQEGEAIRAILGRRSERWIGRDASEARFKSIDLRRYGVVHFAAHALVDEDRAARSAVLLAPGSDREDGRLEMREIVELDAHGLAVVLSGCRTASGEHVPGEGALSLARGFLVAGARATVASLWLLRDDDALAVFEGLYRHLDRGASLAQALAAVRRERIADGAPAEAWAGLIVLGDGEFAPIAAGGGRAPVWTAVLVAGGLALLLFAVLRLRRARARRPGA